MATPRTGKGTVLVAGSANVDHVVRAPRVPVGGETILGGDLQTLPGGKGANQAVAAACAGGARVRMLAALGDDAGGRMLAASLAAAGVALDRVASDRPTGAALITVSDAGENAITVAPGANAALSPGDLPDLTGPEWAGVAWLAMQLETPIETVTAFARAARAAGVRVMLNVAPARALPAELLGSIDVLVANEEELAAVAGRDGTVADRLARLGVPTAIVTLGARGACAWHGDAGAGGAWTIQPAFPVDAIDTTGAGDTFCGVLAAELAADRPLDDALRVAAAAAALSTTRPGAQSSVPDRAAVERLAATDRDNTGARDALARYCGIA